MLKWISNFIFGGEEPVPRGWPHSHRAWYGVEIRNVGIIVGWDNEPGVVLCLTDEAKFVKYRLPDYKGDIKC